MTHECIGQLQSFDKIPPQAKNERLKGFYLDFFRNLSFHDFIDDPYDLLHLPSFRKDDPNSNDVIIARSARIMKSELIGSATEYFRLLVSFSNITEGMKEFAVSDFGADIIDLSVRSGDKVELPVWLDKPAAGIFSNDEKELKKIEEEYYGDAIVDILGFVSDPVSSKCTKEIGEEKFNEGSGEFWVRILNKWKEEFIKRYGDEP